MDNEEFKLEVIKALNEKYSFKIRIQRVLIDNGLNKEQAKKDADYICNNVIETGIKLLKGSD